MNFPTHSPRMTWIHLVSYDLAFHGQNKSQASHPKITGKRVRNAGNCRNLISGISEVMLGKPHSPIKKPTIFRIWLIAQKWSMIRCKCLFRIFSDAFSDNHGSGRIAPLETKLIFQGPVFHFHDCGRKSHSSWGPTQKKTDKSEKYNFFFWASQVGRFFLFVVFLILIGK